MKNFSACLCLSCEQAMTNMRTCASPSSHACLRYSLNVYRLGKYLSGTQGVSPLHRLGLKVDGFPNEGRLL